MKSKSPASLHLRVEEVLEVLRPFLHRDQGDVELVNISAEKVVQVALKGNCLSCPMSAMTLQNGIAQSIKSAIPEIRAVEAVNLPPNKA